MNYRRWMDIIIRDFSAFAGQPILYLLALLMVFLGQYSLFAHFVLSFILIDVISLTIRFFKYKDRPLKIIYSNLVEKLDASSFPSIHSARAMMMFLMFSAYFSSVAVTALLGVAAVLVCYSRVYLKSHHMSDVVGGVIIGILVWYGVASLPPTIFPF